jgi:hypothetical protein
VPPTAPVFTFANVPVKVDALLMVALSVPIAPPDPATKVHAGLQLIDVAVTVGAAPPLPVTAATLLTDEAPWVADQQTL